MTPRKRLSDILQSSSDRDRLRHQFAETKAANDFGKPLPEGKYVARIIDGALETSRTRGTLGFKLTFQVLDGDHAGRRFWYDVWLSEAALSSAKRDLSKLGVTDLAQLDNGLPPGIVCAVKLVLRREDDGAERNRVRSFEVLRIETPEVDPYHPDAPPVADAPDSTDEELT